MNNPSLIEKIKEGIQKSGFPLELKIGKLLQQNGWGYSVGNIYKDFETGKYREADIIAQTKVNGITVTLFVECKKSSDKQIVLYAPKSTKRKIFLDFWIKLFPRIRFTDDTTYNPTEVIGEFERLPYFDENIPFAKNLIVTKGSSVTQENVNYISSINGLIKSSIYFNSEGNLDTNIRHIFLYVFVFEGALFQLSNSTSEEFDLKEINYGQFDYECNIQFQSNENKALVNTANLFGRKFLIETMTPAYFESYIQNIKETLEGINVYRLNGWGEN